jgi:hypothetical protein
LQTPPLLLLLLRVSPACLELPCPALPCPAEQVAALGDALLLLFDIVFWLYQRWAGRGRRKPRQNPLERPRQRANNRRIFHQCDERILTISILDWVV